MLEARTVSFNEEEEEEEAAAAANVTNGPTYPLLALTDSLYLLIFQSQILSTTASS